MHPLWLLIILALTFLGQGAMSLWSMWVTWTSGSISLNVGVFCIPIGIGLFKLQDKARRWGVAYAAVLLLLVLYAAIPLLLGLSWPVPDLNGGLFAANREVTNAVGWLVFAGLLAAFQLVGLRYLRSRFTFETSNVHETEAGPVRKASRARLAFGWLTMLLLVVVGFKLAVANEPNCSLVPQPAVFVDVRDAITDASIVRGSETRLDGSGSSSRTETWGDAPAVLNATRSGYYTLSVEREGYQPSSRRVRVKRKDGCALERKNVTVRLRPLRITAASHAHQARTSSPGQSLPP